MPSASLNSSNSSTPSVDTALRVIRSKLPAKVFTLLQKPLHEELESSLGRTHNDDDDIVDAMLALSDIFKTDDQHMDATLDPLKQRLANAAFYTETSESADKLRNDIAVMTLEGVMNKDPIYGCASDSTIASLFAVCTMYPLGSPEARLDSITSVFAESAQEFLDTQNLSS